MDLDELKLKICESTPLVFRCHDKIDWKYIGGLTLKAHLVSC